MRRLDPSDPRSLEHPSHREAWLNLARVIWAEMELEDWDAPTPKNKGGPHRRQITVRPVDD
jgi:hypothetical protein